MLASQYIADGVRISSDCLYQPWRSLVGEVSYRNLAEVELLRNVFAQLNLEGRWSIVDAGVASLRGLMAASLVMLVGFLLIPKYGLIFGIRTSGGSRHL